ncbi:hypothetical protein Pfo_011738 [Paulownia fortunei]|nr:hypothetical protein Pfo_011738 [Paulownia fortunei]
MMWSPCPITFNTLLGALNSRGRFSEAEDFWNLMVQRGAWQGERKRLSEAMEVFKDLEENGLKPNNYTYNLLIKGFVNEGNLEEVRKWYAMMLNCMRLRSGFCHIYDTYSLCLR